MFTVTTFYHFFPIAQANVQAVRDDLDAKGQELDLFGLTLVATEGFNGTIAGSAEAIEQYKEFLRTYAPDILFKDSTSEQNPFKRWFVKIREEIVALGNTDVLPDDMHDDTHVPPEEWDRMIEEEDIVLLDTRNDYETKIGTFKGAVDPNLKQFSEFPGWVEQCDIPKDKKVMMFCTGGIRCEKACIEMKNQGYKHVYQLKGGILQYFKEKPHSYFEGECFVFDHRAAVDQELNPSTTFRMCPHCGDPGDLRITCAHCGKEAIICEECNKKDPYPSCNKDCKERHRRKLKKVAS